MSGSDVPERGRTKLLCPKNVINGVREACVRTGNSTQKSVYSPRQCCWIRGLPIVEEVTVNYIRKETIYTVSYTMYPSRWLPSNTLQVFFHRFPYEGSPRRKKVYYLFGEEGLLSAVLNKKRRLSRKREEE